MGDRGNIVILDSSRPADGQVYLYTHWGGSALGEHTHNILNRRQRWNDPAYLARIAFNELVGDDKGETGYGISATIGDNEYQLVVLDTGQQKVFLVDEAHAGRLHGWVQDNADTGIPFEDVASGRKEVKPE